MSHKQEITENLLYYKKLVTFQADLMEHLYASRTEIFNLISDFFDCSHIILLVCDEKGVVQCNTFDAEEDSSVESYQFLDGCIGKLLQSTRKLYQKEHELSDELRQFLTRSNISKVDYVTCFSGKSDNVLYSAILCHSKDNDIEEGMEVKLVNYVQIYLENRIFHERVTFESQHDMLTKLYNRRYYFKCSQEVYPLLASIGIFYFDVNNLKETNDNYGHDAGDALLQKAAESIRCLTNENVQGFRMGGDEFILVVMNCTKNDMTQIKTRWENELKKINEKYGGEPCVIAMGAAYGKGSFEIEELCQIADKRMYQDKVNKKKNAVR